MGVFIQHRGFPLWLGGGSRELQLREFDMDDENENENDNSNDNKP